MLEVRALGLKDVFEIIPPRVADDRGFFSETYSAPAMAEAGIAISFVQDNHSLSHSVGVLRGLHYQLPPAAQDKLVRVVRGAILDVVVDIRKGSRSYAQWLALEISADKWNQILVPKGFAHGFVTLMPDTEVAYKVSHPYSREHDRSIRFDDPQIGIDWGLVPESILLSDKDRKAPLLANADIFEPGAPC